MGIEIDDSACFPVNVFGVCGCGKGWCKGRVAFSSVGVSVVAGTNR